MLRECRVDAFEVHVDACDAHQIDRDFKEELKVLVARLIHDPLFYVSPNAANQPPMKEVGWICLVRGPFSLL